MKKYGFNFFWSEEDGGYIATCPDFPGLSAFGETLEEATQQATSALKGFIQVLEADGAPLPEPTILPEYSGQFRLRLPSTLHRGLAERARAEGMSLNSYIVYQLAERNAAAYITQGIIDHIDAFERKIVSHTHIISNDAIAWQTTEATSKYMQVSQNQNLNWITPVKGGSLLCQKLEPSPLTTRK
jgi:predicted RNase H-like HicB family nuclease